MSFEDKLKKVLKKNPNSLWIEPNWDDGDEDIEKYTIKELLVLHDIYEKTTAPYQHMSYLISLVEFLKKTYLGLWWTQGLPLEDMPLYINITGRNIYNSIIAQWRLKIGR
jgi:hypothetical protein